jgi:sulfur-carrier protein
VAQNPRRTAGNRLRAERIHRGRFCILRANPARGPASVLIEKRCSHVKPLAAKKRVIVPVTFHIPGPLREFTGGLSTVTVEQAPVTLAEALSALWMLYPALRDRLTTEQGQMREHVNIFIGDEDVRYTGGLTSPLSAGSVISIVPAISGGCPVSFDHFGAP